MLPSPDLPIHIRPGNLQTSPAIETWVQRKLAGPFRRYGPRMTAVEVHFGDVDGPKHGAADAQCVMEARVNGRPPIAVRARARDLYTAIDAAARKLEAAIARAVARPDTRERRRLRRGREAGIEAVARPEPTSASATTAASAASELAAEDPGERGRRDPGLGSRAGVIIAGFGPVGRALADELAKHGVPITVVDTNSEAMRRQADLGARVVCGDVTDPAVLKRAGIDTAAALAITIPDGADAVRACATARALSADVHIAARTTFLSQGLEAVRAGADSITVEEIATAAALARVVTQHVTSKPYRPDPEVAALREGAD